MYHTIYVWWVTLHNTYAYCFREMWFVDYTYLYDTPTQNAATQNSPDDLTSLDLYWRAPPNPDSPEEYRQLPQQIQFW